MTSFSAAAPVWRLTNLITSAWLVPNTGTAPLNHESDIPKLCTIEELTGGIRFNQLGQTIRLPTILFGDRTMGILYIRKMKSSERQHRPESPHHRSASQDHLFSAECQAGSYSELVLGCK